MNIVNLHIFGAGYWTEEALAILKEGDYYGNTINVIALRDDDTTKQGKGMFGVPILSMDADKDVLPQNVKILSLVNNIQARVKAAKIFKNQNDWWTYIHPTTCIRDRVNFAHGVFVAPRCHIAVGASIGSHCRIAYEVMVSENVIIEDFCTIQSRVFIGGYTIIREGVSIGAGAIIKDNLEIGTNSQIAIGTVVVRNVPPNTIIGGNPGRVISNL